MEKEPQAEAAAETQKGVEERVVARILARRDKGRAKYGQSMERQDLNIMQWLRHAQDEATDLAIYLERIQGDITSVSEWSGPDCGPPSAQVHHPPVSEQEEQTFGERCAEKFSRHLEQQGQIPLLRIFKEWLAKIIDTLDSQRPKEEKWTKLKVGGLWDIYEGDHFVVGGLSETMVKHLITARNRTLTDSTEPEAKESKSL